MDGEWCDTSDPDAKTPAKELYDHFKQWCEAAGLENFGNPTSFGRALRDKHHGVWKDSKGTRWRKGISLRPAWSARARHGRRRGGLPHRFRRVDAQPAVSRGRRLLRVTAGYGGSGGFVVVRWICAQARAREDVS
jgi:phage/plasmid-associated DNA primase